MKKEHYTNFEIERISNGVFKNNEDLMRKYLSRL